METRGQIKKIMTLRRGRACSGPAGGTRGRKQPAPPIRTRAADRSPLSYLHIGRKQESLYIKYASFLYKLNIKSRTNYD